MKLQDNLILVPMLATLSSSVDGANHVGIHSLSSQNVKLTSERVQHASHSTGAPISHRQLTPRGTRGIKYRSRRRREQEEEDIDVSNPNETRKIGSLRKRKKKGSRSNKKVKTKIVKSASTKALSSVSTSSSSYSEKVKSKGKNKGKDKSDSFDGGYVSHSPDKENSSESVDIESSSDSSLTIVVIPETGRDTSECTNAYTVMVDETVNAEATHAIDSAAFIRCDQGFEVENPFVQVMGMWFAVPGTAGRTKLQASSCPALLSVYRSDNGCDNLECAAATYNELGCEVEWESADVGTEDYILVQNIEYNGGGLIDLPLVISIQEASTPDVSIPENDEEDLTGLDGTDPQDTPPPAQLSVIDQEVCESANAATVGDSTWGFMVTVSNNIGYCKGSGGAINLDDVDVDVTGTWFTVSGTGGTLRASACPSMITIFTGECDNLTCVDIVQAPLGCEIEWESELARTDYLLVQSMENVGEGEEAAASVFLTIDDLGSREPAEDQDKDEDEHQDQIDESPNDTNYWAINEDRNEAVDDETGDHDNNTDQDGVQDEADESPSVGNEDYWAISDNSNEQNQPSYQDACQNAQDISEGDAIVASASQLSGDFLECDGGLDLNGFDVPVLGAWFRVAGNGQILKASSCPSRISVYSGTCDNPRCTESISNQSGCVVEWESAPIGQFDYILIQTFGFDGMGANFPISVSVEDPATSNSMSDGEDTVTLDTGEPENDTNHADAVPSESSVLGSPNDLMKGAERDCIESLTIEVNEWSIVPLSVPFASLFHCSGAPATSDSQSDALFGSWYTIAGNAQKYRASACPAQISVFQGECDSLECVETSVVADSGGCEIEWDHPGSRSQPQHILVQSPALTDESADPVVLQLVEVA